VSGKHEAVEQQDAADGAGDNGAPQLILVLYGPRSVMHCGKASLAAVRQHRGSTNGRGVITALARLSKGCAACVGVTALAEAGIGQAPRHAPVPFLRELGPASLRARVVELVNGGGSYARAAQQRVEADGRAPAKPLRPPAA
jgi:hypothetical protein